MTIFEALKMRYNHFDVLRINTPPDTADNRILIDNYKVLLYSTAAALMGCTIHTLNYDIGDVDEARLFTDDSYSFGKYLGELEGKYFAKFYNNIRPAD